MRIDTSVQVGRRDFSQALDTGWDWDVQSLVWAAVGGPEMAILESDADVTPAQALDLLRCPVVVSVAHQPVWWGFVESVDVGLDAWRVGASLESMTNYTAVAYSYVAPGSQEVGQRRTTAWVGDEESRSVYGTKAALLSVSGASDAQAEAVRDTYLAQQRWPRAQVMEGEGGARLRVVARGWWDTLAWQYYGNTDTTSTTVVGRLALVALAAPFVTGTDVDLVSTPSASAYADGESTMREYVEDLLRTGSSGDVWLAEVTQDRVLRVQRAAASTASTAHLRLGLDGGLRTAWGEPVLWSPAGQWVDVDSADLWTLGYVSSPSPFLCQRAELLLAERRWRVEPWGAPSAWDLTRLLNG
jgi:hypothetical protein